MRVTAHALDRAKERLGVDKFTFEVWCDATRNDWMPVNYSYLISHNVKVSKTGGEFYITPWVFGTNLAIVVRQNEVVTVVPFKDYAGMQKPVVPKKTTTDDLDLHAQVLLKCLKDKNLELGKEMLQKLLRRDLNGPFIEDVLRLYLDDKCSLQELQDFAGSTHKTRERELTFFRSRLNVGV